jgi:hypothetical protein
MQTILILLLLAVAIVLAIAATKPGEYTVSRSLSINASADKLYAIINTPKEFERWSPYSPKDPAMVNRYSGPASGVGARNDFVGNNQVGTGSVEITGSTAPSEVVMLLTMVKPFAAKNTVTYSLARQDSATLVTWAMTAKAPFLAKVISVFVNMDNMIGRDFADGLARLKKLVENG